MKKLMIVLTGIALLFSIYLAYLGHVSRTGAAPALDGGKLAACPDKPNCVCSECLDDADHFIAPFTFSRRPASEVMRSLVQITQALGGQVDTVRDDYVAVRFSSTVFGFVDDVQFRADPEAKVIHVRSASRVGTSDLGANRNRVEEIRRRFQASGAGN